MMSDSAVAPTDAELSRLLFEARESVEMWADVVEARTGKADNYTRGLVARIDAYRAERGWSPHGFGGEFVRISKSEDYLIALEKAIEQLSALKSMLRDPSSTSP
jgi:glutamine synthetase